MANTISDLWNGNIAPVEHCGSHDLKANMLIGMVEQQKEALIDSLTNTQLEIFRRFLNCSEDYLFRMQELAFCEGFTLGSKLAMEILY